MSAIPHVDPHLNRRGFAGVAWGIAAMCLFLAIAIRIMTAAVTAEENALATLMSQLGHLRLYDQIEFSRGPLVALYLQAVHAIAGQIDPVLAIRLAAVAAWAVSGVVVWKVALRASGSPMMAFFCLAAVMANEYLIEWRGEAILAASLCVAPVCVGYAYHRAAVSGPGRIRPAFASGLAFGLAIAIAPSLAVIYSILLLGTFIYPRSEDPVVRLTRIAAPSALGVVIGAFPVAIYWAADPAAVMASLANPLLGHLGQSSALVFEGTSPVAWIPAALLAIVVVLLGLTRRPALPMLPSDGVAILLVCAVASALGFVAASGNLPELANAALIALAMAAAIWWPSVRPTPIRSMTPVVAVAMGAIVFLPLVVQAPRWVNPATDRGVIGTILDIVVYHAAPVLATETYRDSECGSYVRDDAAVSPSGRLFRKSTLATEAAARYLRVYVRK